MKLRPLLTGFIVSLQSDYFASSLPSIRYLGVHSSFHCLFYFPSLSSWKKFTSKGERFINYSFNPPYTRLKPGSPFFRRAYDNPAAK